MQERILITGGAGYIGSHTCLELAQHGYQVVALDNLCQGHRDFARFGEFILGDVGDQDLLDLVFSKYDIKAVMHFAAHTNVGESVLNPAKYYLNNLRNTAILLEAMRRASVKYFVFSSTCATYGLPVSLPLLESNPQLPISPYGRSKLMIEQILQDYSTGYGLNYVALRYFNAAGADSEGRLGERHDPETHLIPLVLMAALDPDREVRVFGTDYDTLDGTCIRDYIHVTDLARAHQLALDYLLDGGESAAFNIGNGRGFSVKEVLDCAARVTGKPIRVVNGERRPGDLPCLVGGTEKIRRVLGWEPRIAALEDIIKTAWKWMNLSYPAGPEK